MKRGRNDVERVRQLREHMESAANAKAEVEADTGKIRMEEETRNRRERVNAGGARLGRGQGSAN